MRYLIMRYFMRSHWCITPLLYKHVQRYEIPVIQVAMEKDI